MRTRLFVLTAIVLLLTVAGCSTAGKVAPDSSVGKIVPGGSNTADTNGHVINVSSDDSTSRDNGNGLDLNAARQLVPAGK
ncbi:MAG: hypothetical protein ACI9G1_002945 [Pirellulaceae bacterium]|jgi:hypothetical protein